MLTGKKFRPERCTVALDGIDSHHHRMMTIPAGETVEVVSEPTTGGRLVDVLWQGLVLTMFAYDVDVPGTEVSESQPFGLSASA